MHSETPTAPPARPLTNNQRARASSHWIFTLFSLHQLLMMRTMYSTWGLLVFRTMARTSRRSSFCALPATTCWKTPTHAPRLPSQYSGSGSKRSSTSNAFGIQELSHPIAVVRDELQQVE